MDCGGVSGRWTHPAGFLSTGPETYPPFVTGGGRSQTQVTSRWLSQEARPLAAAAGGIERGAISTAGGLT